MSNKIEPFKFSITEYRGGLKINMFNSAAEVQMAFLRKFDEIYGNRSIIGDYDRDIKIVRSTMIGPLGYHTIFLATPLSVVTDNVKENISA